LAAAGGSRVSAHRLDEFLQAARIAVEPDRVMLELSLTPGTAVAAQVIRSIDADRDGVLSAAEKQAYAERALSAMVLRVDEGLRLPVTMMGFDVPDAAAMRSGDGVIAIRAEAQVPPWLGGSHRLLFRNEHAPAGSVYLANALVPASGHVMVTAQQRDADQRALTIEFAVTSDEAGASPWPWIVGGAFGSAWLLRRSGGQRRLHA
jgi:hypothetical protein